MSRCIVLITLFVLLHGLARSQYPSVTSVVPSSGTQGENLSNVIISGSGFVGPVSVDFGIGIDVTVNTVTPSFILVDISISAASPVGMHDVIVVNATGYGDTLHGGFEVHGETAPPVCNVVFPSSTSPYVACPDTCIIISVFDLHGIDETSVVFEYDEVVYTYLSPELNILGDTLIAFCPSATLDGDTVHFSLVSIADEIGNVSITPVSGTVVFDFSEPFMNEPEPPIASSIADYQPQISVSFSDASGLNRDGVQLVINDTLFFSIASPSLRWNHDTLLWSSAVAGLTFALEETIDVCVILSDNVSSAACGPNVLDTCWFFYVHVPPPADFNVRVLRIYTEQFPLLSALVNVNAIDSSGGSYGLLGLDEENFRVMENYGTGWVMQYPLFTQPLSGVGKVDVVFCIDTTGSMGWLISDVLAGLNAFVESLAIAGISYRLGLVTFADSVNFPHGYNLTSDVGAFASWISALGAEGGGDWPEVSLDAVYDALECMNFRFDARKIIILITDASAHYLGDGTVFSDVTPSMVLAKLIEKSAICYVVKDTTAMPDDLTPFRTISIGSGGAFYSWSGPGSFQLILDVISENVLATYKLSWTSSHPFAECEKRPTYVEVSAYDMTRSIVDTYLAPCAPEGIIVVPLPNTWSAFDSQQIQVVFSDLDDAIDTTSVRFFVDGNLYTHISPEMTISGIQLRWSPPALFSNGQIVSVELSRIMDVRGHIPITNPLMWQFGIDLAPPKVNNRSPDRFETVDSYQPRICFDIWDEESGLNLPFLVVEISDITNPSLAVVIHTNPAVSYDGRRFCIDVAQLGIAFVDRDTVCVALINAKDDPDYGSPHSLPDSLARWCFYIADDDTVCPQVSLVSPDTSTVLSGEPFVIEFSVSDMSGVSGTQVIWDNDGELNVSADTSAGIFNGINWFVPVPCQNEQVSFVFKICACDADTDMGQASDASCCCTQEMRLNFGRGPVAQIIEPLPHSVTSVARQKIRIRLYDSGSGYVEQSSIVIRVNGVPYTVDGAFLRYWLDTLEFVPQTDWVDGESVSVELISATDNFGNLLQTPLNWRFFVDTLPPTVISTDPIHNSVILNDRMPIKFQVIDRWREIDLNSISIFIERFATYFHWGEPAISFSNDYIVFSPSQAGLSFPNGDTVCIVLTCSDVVPDYGDGNVMQPFELCFVYALDYCRCSHRIFTPNGDGINDYVSFGYPGSISRKGEIKIYNIFNELIWESRNGETIWNGKNKDGHNSLPGLYLYVIMVDGKAVCEGTVTIAR